METACGVLEVILVITQNSETRLCTIWWRKRTWFRLHTCIYGILSHYEYQLILSDNYSHQKSGHTTGWIYYSRRVIDYVSKKVSPVFYHRAVVKLNGISWHETRISALARFSVKALWLRTVVFRQTFNGLQGQLLNIPDTTWQNNRQRRIIFNLKCVNEAHKTFL